MRRNGTARAATFVACLTALVVLLSSSATLADTLTAGYQNVNGVITGGNVSKAPGTTGTAYVSVTATNTPSGDPSGCDVTGSSPGTVTVTSSKTSDVTIDSPASQQAVGCGNVLSFPYTVKSTATGGDAVTITATATGGKANSAYTQGTFTVTIIAADSTPPSITPHVSGTIGNNGWYVSNVSVSWTVSDPDSAISSSSGCDPTTISTDTTGTTLTCSATSGGGTSSNSVTIKRDATPPTVSLRPAGDSCTVPGTNGWCRGTQYAGFTATDATSGISPSGASSVDFTQSTTTQGSSVSIPSGTVSDMAGNTASSINAGPYKIDSTPPVVTGTPDRDPNTNGWYNAPVTITWSAGSGDTCDAATTYSGPDGQNIPITGSCSDAAGNTASATVDINYDATAPTITFHSRTEANKNGWNNSDVTVDWTCSDGGSGVVSPTVSKTVSSEGANQSATGTCTDLAGNSASDEQTGINIDKTAPTITFHSRTEANTNGWNNTNVTVDWICSDDGSGPVAASVSNTESTEGLNQSADGTCTDLAGNWASDTQYGISIDKTPPTITFDSRTPANGNGWNNGDVTLTWDCADLLSGPTLTQVTQTVTTEGGGQSSTGTCTDYAGNTANDTQTGINIDLAAPTITLHSRTPANGYGWNNGDVTVTWDCSDGLSGVEHPTVSQTVSIEGTNQSATGTCADLAGNSASATQTGINIDETSPTITYVSTTPAANALDWNNTDVTVTWSCSDDRSGVVSDPVTTSVSTEGASQTATGTCTDKAGNTASDSEGSGINIDKTPPTSIQFVGGIGNGSSFVYGLVPAQPTCTASDALSGLASCTVTGYSTAVGSHTLTAKAIDHADNSATSQISYAVTPWTLTGFYQPVDMSGIVNTVKNGSTVPLKFNVYQGNTQLTNLSAVSGLYATPYTCSSNAPTDDIEATSTGGTSLRYDTTAGQFVYNWQTPKTSGACIKVTVKTADGSALSALFKLK